MFIKVGITVVAVLQMLFGIILFMRGDTDDDFRRKKHGSILLISGIFLLVLCFLIAGISTY